MYDGMIWSLWAERGEAKKSRCAAIEKVDNRFEEAATSVPLKLIHTLSNKSLRRDKVTSMQMLLRYRCPLLVSQSYKSAIPGR